MIGREEIDHPEEIVVGAAEGPAAVVDGIAAVADAVVGAAAVDGIVDAAAQSEEDTKNFLPKDRCRLSPISEPTEKATA